MKITNSSYTASRLSDSLRLSRRKKNRRMFRKFGLGKLIGKRTWGGLVGVLGFPVLMDGGYVTALNLAIWTEDGFIVENVGRLIPKDKRNSQAE